jgi:RND family efflux transporter MFP subunit
MKLPEQNFTLATLVAALTVLFAACSDKPVTTTAPAPPPAAPASVNTVLAQQRDFAVVLEANGAVSPIANVDVRPQATSVVSRVHIREGQFVRAGDLLFTLDARADEANVARARAQMTRDEASLADARRQLARSRDLVAQNFISQGAVDTSQALVESQTALVAADRAALEAASVSLSYARVTAPSAGRIGVIPVFPGSAVQANQTTLVTITQINPINVTFSLPQRNLADALSALNDGGAEVQAILADGAGTLTGRLTFVDNAVDQASGNVKVKALFDNRDGKLWPGAFVNVAITLRTIRDAVVVPQAAFIQTPRGTSAYVVEEGGKAALRPVKVLQSQGEDAVVSGIRAGERIVLEGRQNLRPGSTVVERTPDSNAAPGAKKSGKGKNKPADGAPAASALSATPSAPLPSTPETAEPNQEKAK